MKRNPLAVIFVLGGFGAVITGLCMAPMPIWVKIGILGIITFLIGGGMTEE